MATTHPSQPAPGSSSISSGNAGGSVSQRAGGNIVGGDNVGRDKIGGDNVAGDKVAGPKITNIINEADKRGPVFAAVPPRPVRLVGRAELVSNLIARIGSLAGLGAVAVDGLPGVGKTALAVAVAFDDRVTRHFPDGVLWGALGQHPEVAGVLSLWLRALKGDAAEKEHSDKNRRPLEVLRREASGLIGQGRYLLVIDDAWDIEAANLLRCGGPGCGYLLTTRDKAVARSFAGVENAFVVSPLEPDDALEVVCALAPEASKQDPRGVQELVTNSGGLPMQLELLGGYLAAPTHSMFADFFPDLSKEALEKLADPGHRLQLAQRRLGDSQGGTITLLEVVELSLDGLPPQARQAFRALGAFVPKPDWFSRAAAEAVTQTGPQTLVLLAAQNLVEVDAERGLMTLHPTVSDVARAGISADAIRRHQDYYLAQVREDRYDSWKVTDIFGQLKHAWHSLPDDPGLLEWVATLRSFFVLRERWSEYIAWAERALAVTDQPGLQRERGRLLAEIGLANNRLRIWDRAHEYFERALPFLEAADDALNSGRVHHNDGYALMKLGKGQAGKRLLRAIELLRNAGDHQGIRSAYLLLTALLTGAGKTEEAELCRKVVESLIGLELIPEPKSEGVLPVKLDLSFILPEGYPDVLVYLQTMVDIGRGDAGFDGIIAVAVRHEGQERFSHWHARFADGKKIGSELSAEPVPEADVRIILSERDGDAILHGKPLSNPQVIGDRDLLLKFVERYLEREVEPPMEKARRLIATGGALRNQSLFSSAATAFEEAVDLLSQLAKDEQNSPDKSDLAKALAGRAQTYQELNRTAEAVADCDKVIAMFSAGLPAGGDLAETAVSVFELRIRARAIENADLRTVIRDLGDAILVLSPVLEGGSPNHVLRLASLRSFRGGGLIRIEEFQHALVELDAAVLLFAGLLQKGESSGVRDKWAESLMDRGKARLALEDTEGALADWSAAIAALSAPATDSKPSALLAELLLARAEGLEKTEQYSGALSDLEKAVRLYDDRVAHGHEDSTPLADAANDVAWMLLQCPEVALRDATRALEFATRASELTQGSNYQILDTLAAAHAECGDFVAATRWQTRAVELAPADEWSDYEARLTSYRAGQPTKVS